MSKNIHIGKKIKEVVIQSRLKKTEFADLINISRTVVYDIFKRETIDTALLQKISNVLKHDFFNYYQKHELPVVNDNTENYGYATKEELKQTELTILKEIERLRQEINPATRTSVKKKITKRKK
jgi:transcriptional regulator with XRE-family HTH domain